MVHPAGMAMVDLPLGKNIRPGSHSGPLVIPPQMLAVSSSPVSVIAPPIATRSRTISFASSPQPVSNHQRAVRSQSMKISSMQQTTSSLPLTVSSLLQQDTSPSPTVSRPVAVRTDLFCSAPGPSTDDTSQPPNRAEQVATAETSSTNIVVGKYFLCIYKKNIETYPAV